MPWGEGRERVRHIGDITRLSGAKIEPVDIITGGSPCQDLSVAGLRKGLGGKRSGLFTEQIRIIREMREADVLRGRTGELIRPRYCIWENVPGAFSSNGGKDFQAVLSEFIRIADPNAPDVPLPHGGKWQKWGGYMGTGSNGRWSVAYRVHDAQHWGVPQRRRRICVLADYGGWTAHRILFDHDYRREAETPDSVCAFRNTGSESRREIQPVGESVSGDSEPCGAERQETAGAVGESANSASGFTNRGYATGNVAETLRSGEGGNQKPCIMCGNPLDPQSERVFHGDGAWHSLNSNSNGGQSRDAVLTYDARGNGDAKTVCTLTGDHQDRVTDYTALCVVNGQLNQMSMAEQSNTLDTMHDQQAVLCFQNTGYGWWNESEVGANVRTPCGGDGTKATIVTAIDCRNSRGTEEVSGTLQAKKTGGYSLNYQNPVLTSIVRRLTPLECERLQGFPDGWTDIGEWTDSKGKKHKDADSPRYKALGNSIALPFWDWIDKRISAQYIGVCTLGSLFDGIGGFPLVHSRHNGPRSCRWASEIEEFPIAVTMRHFGDEDAGTDGDIMEYLWR